MIHTNWSGPLSEAERSEYVPVLDAQTIFGPMGACGHLNCLVPYVSPHHEQLHEEGQATRSKEVRQLKIPRILRLILKQQETPVLFRIALMNINMSPSK
jgi:hypothetical protein